jgi:hypothetical protein
MVAGLSLMVWIRFFTPIAWTWYAVIGTTATVMVGYIASFLGPQGERYEDA